MLVKNWGKMPYPKFLQTTYAKIIEDSECIWKGFCYFSWSMKKIQRNDGTEEKIFARATTDEDIRIFLENYDKVSFVIESMQKEFVIRDVLPSFNPNGNFHHISLTLLEAI